MADTDTVDSVDTERQDALQTELDSQMFPDNGDETPDIETEVPIEDSAAEATATIPAAPTDKTPPIAGKPAPVPATGKTAGPVAAPVVPSTATAPATPATAQAPKAWPKEMHEHWGKLDPVVKEYLEKREHQMLEGLEQYKGDATMGRDFKEVVGPYVPHLKAAGIEPKQMVGNLLNAHWILTRGTAESKAAYEKLGRDLGFAAADPNAPQPNPEVQALQREVRELQSGLTARQQAELQQQEAKLKVEVDTFASDTVAHPYFEECADDIIALLHAYPKLSLQECYDRAVYANPVTRAKELAKVETSTEAKLRENARLDALPKKRAAGVNVHSRETNSAPTEPLGTMDDTLESTLRGIKERTH